MCAKQDMGNCSTEDMSTLNRYNLINERYQSLFTIQI